MVATVDKFTLIAAVQSAPREHALRASGDGYRDAFVSAFLDVYGHKTNRQTSEILKRKYLISADSKYSENAFLQGASELSVAHHIKHCGATKFETDKRVNSTNNRDVDVFAKLMALSICTEVKCPEESESNEAGFYLRTDGRIPNHTGIHEDLRAQVEAAHPDMTLKLAKNKDNALNQFLTEAHLKFDPDSSVDDLNILFVACGDHANMNSWHRYLYGRGGLFTANSFSPPQQYRNVDVVILSNLKYRHQAVRGPADWSLENTLMLPFVNPHGRPTALRETILNGLSMFQHHLEPFSKYSVTTDDPNIESDVWDSVEVIHYVAEQLSEDQRIQYFPTIRKWKA